MHSTFVNIVHPDVPGVGRCSAGSLRVWEAKGWTVVADVAPVREDSEPKLVNSYGVMVPVDAEPEWTGSGALEEEATGAASDEESHA